MNKTTRTENCSSETMNSLSEAQSNLNENQLQHIKNTIRSHKVKFLYYNGNTLGWHHYLEFPSELFPEFNEDVLSEIWEHVGSYTDDDIKHIRCVYVDFDERIVWVDLISHAEKIIALICPNSLLERIYKDADKLASEYMGLLCKTAYQNSLSNAVKFAEDELIQCCAEDLSKIIPYDEWLDYFIKKLLTSAWRNISPGYHICSGDWYTEPHLNHQHISPIHMNATTYTTLDDLPF